MEEVHFTDDVPANIAYGGDLHDSGLMQFLEETSWGEKEDNKD